MDKNQNRAFVNNNQNDLKKSSKKPFSQLANEDRVTQKESKPLFRKQTNKYSNVKPKVYDYLGKSGNPRHQAIQKQKEEESRRSISQQPFKNSVYKQNSRAELQNLNELRNKRKSKTPDCRMHEETIQEIEESKQQIVNEDARLEVYASDNNQHSGFSQYLIRTSSIVNDN